MLVIINPTAGKKKGIRSLVRIRRIFSQAGYECKTYRTKKRGDAMEITRSVLLKPLKSRSKKISVVTAIGGDGTFNEVIAGLRSTGLNIPVGYIPAGSTNDFAKSLKLSGFPFQAAKDIVRGKPGYLDIGDFNGRPFTYVASCGIFTHASYSAPQEVKNMIGHLAYILEGIKDLKTVHPMHMKVETKEATYEGDYIYAALCNSTSFGGVLKLDPNIVDLNDGLLEMLLIRMPKDILELGKIVHALTVREYDNPMIELHSVDEVKITMDSDEAWTLDGEYQKGNEEILIRNIHDAYQLIRWKK